MINSKKIIYVLDLIIDLIAEDTQSIISGKKRVNKDVLKDIAGGKSFFEIVHKVIKLNQILKNDLKNTININNKKLTNKDIEILKSFLKNYKD